VVTVAAELLAPTCLFWPRASFVFVPALVAFHWGTWATMDTGPYLTLWYLWVAFVPLDRVRTWVRSTWATRPALAGAGVVWGIVVLAVVATVIVRVVPWPMLGAALLLHGLVVRLERSR
jgi:hypothetical protein